MSTWHIIFIYTELIWTINCYLFIYLNWRVDKRLVVAETNFREILNTGLLFVQPDFIRVYNLLLWQLFFNFILDNFFNFSFLFLNLFNMRNQFGFKLFCIPISVIRLLIINLLWFLIWDINRFLYWCHNLCTFQQWKSLFLLNHWR